MSTLGALKELARLLREADEEPKKEEGEDSVDAQIDKYLSQYESQAKEENEQKLESVSRARMTWDWRRLTEAEGDEEEGGADESEEPEKTPLEDINMGSFVSDVMRLVENYESLLEIKNTVLRRAANYLSQNYEGDALQAFKDELKESYDVEIGQSESEKDDEVQAPRAGAAGPMAGGAA